MSFQRDIQELKEALDSFESVGQLRSYLLGKDMRLVLTICTPKVSFLDWDITRRKVCGILHLGMKVRISRSLSGDAILETRTMVPITFDQVEWINQNDLFETLKEGIKESIKKIC
ncbi:MAG: hypothetical protein KDK96_10825 [Chlamydiia bacterium]|nr:hypothetical protein [Simkania sp.]MCB1073572.1 hypothetical protein [Chlamydiia bacterium]